MKLLDGINEEAVDLLKDKVISPNAIRLLKKVTGLRQIEIAELMVSANNFTKVYAEALVLGTSKDELVNPEVPKKKQGMTREQIAKMELEMETIERDLKAVEKSYGENMLSLTVVRGYYHRQIQRRRDALRPHPCLHGFHDHFVLGDRIQPVDPGIVREAFVIAGDDALGLRLAQVF
jgi:hypothetical protein